MIQFEELRLSLERIQPEILDLAEALGLEAMKSEIEQLENKAAEPGFWDDMEKSQVVLQRTSGLKSKLEGYNCLVSKYEDALALIELANEDKDKSSSS